MISLNSVRPFCWFHTYYLITTRFRINNAKISRVIILLSNRTLSVLKCPVYKGFQKIFIIQTLGRRDLFGCFLVHICVFYSSYSSYFAFLCTSSKIIRAKMEPASKINNQLLLNCYRKYSTCDCIIRLNKTLLEFLYQFFIIGSPKFK